MRRVVSAGALPTVCSNRHLSAADSVSCFFLLQASVQYCVCPEALLRLYFDLLHSADSGVRLPAKKVLSARDHC